MKYTDERIRSEFHFFFHSPGRRNEVCRGFMLGYIADGKLDAWGTRETLNRIFEEVATEVLGPCVEQNG